MRKILNDVPTLKVFDFSQYVSKIPGIIKFTIGEPDFDTPEYIKRPELRVLKTIALTMLPNVEQWDCVKRLQIR